MAERDDTIHYLAGLIRAALYGDRSVTARAEAMASSLGIGPDDPVSADAIGAALRKALASPVASGRHPLVVWVNAINGARKPRCFPDVASAYEAASTEHPFNNTRVTLGWCEQKHDQAATAAGEGNDDDHA